MRRKLEPSEWRSRWRWTLFFMLLGMFLLTFCYSGREAANQGTFLVPSEERLDRFGAAVLLAIACMFGFYLWNRKRL